MKLVVGGDHAGYFLKAKVVVKLKEWGHEVNDVGTYSPEPVDFPDIAKRLCEEILSGRADRGVMVCGTGVGAAIAANKVPGIRAALCHDVYSAHQCVEHDDVNVLCLGAWIVGEKLCYDLLDTYLKAQFSTEEQFRRRVRKLSELERASQDTSDERRATHLERQTAFPSDFGGTIRWRMHIPTPPEKVFDLLDSDEGRASFWAESAPMSQSVIEFRFVDGTVRKGKVLKRDRPREFAVEYLGGTARFVLAPDGAGGTDLLLTHEGVPLEEWLETYAGWLNVLFPLKAWAAHGIDLRNHDPKRSWRHGYADQ